MAAVVDGWLKIKMTTTKEDMFTILVDDNEGFEDLVGNKAHE